MGTKLTYHRRAERPPAQFWLSDDDGALIDFTGYTFSFRVGHGGYEALLDKTSGITGSAGSGVDPTGSGNVVINWDVGELDIEPGMYVWQLVCSDGSYDRVFEGTIHILSDIL